MITNLLKFFVENPLLLIDLRRRFWAKDDSTISPSTDWASDSLLHKQVRVQTLMNQYQHLLPSIMNSNSFSRMRVSVMPMETWIGSFFRLHNMFNDNRQYVVRLGVNHWTLGLDYLENLPECNLESHSDTWKTHYVCNYINYSSQSTVS